MHAKIDLKLQKISKIQVLIMILCEGVQKNIQGGFIEFQHNFISYILIRLIVEKHSMDLEMKVGIIKIKLTEEHNTVTIKKHI